MEQQVFVLADRALNSVVQQISDEQWAMKLPGWFQLGGTQDRDTMTLRTVINYHAYDDAWVPDVLAGKTAEEVGVKYDGDLLGEDPKAGFAHIVATAVAAVQALTADDLAKTVHLSYGDFPADEYLKHIISFRGLRTFDIAKLIGVDTQLPEDLVQGMWDLFAPVADEWRKMGVFGPTIEVPADAPLQDRLMGLVGRDPK